MSSTTVKSKKSADKVADCLDVDGPRPRGRPGASFALSKRAIEQRRARLEKYGHLITERQALSKFVSPSLPEQTICVNLPLASLLLLDLYVEFATERFSAFAGRFHHGMVIDTLSQTLRQDEDFARWLAERRGNVAETLTPREGARTSRAVCAI